MKTKTLKLEVSSLVDGPATARVTIDVDLAKRIRKLSAACRKLGVTYISEWNYAPTWGSKTDTDIAGEPWCVECSLLVVSDTDFRWTGIIKHSNILLETETVSLKKLCGLY